ncbi:MAG: tetratricopeptide repeat protein [Candidatus Latescibacteria bacterium]|nr:tetratricopeptide repeat protein [Candidatus Latescibacterota bacterium]
MKYRGKSARFGLCLALAGVFVIGDLQCGGEADDYHQVSLRHLELGELGRALAATRQGIRLDRRRVDFYLVAALAYLGRERVEEAFVALGEAIRVRPGDSRIYAAMQDIARRRQRFDLALATLEALPRRLGEDGQVRATLGWAYVQLEQDQTGLGLLEEVVGEGAEEPYVFAALGRVYVRQGRFAEAVELLQKALDRTPEEIPLMWLLAECQTDQGQVEEADFTFARLVDVSDEKAGMAVEIARFFYGRQQLRKAIHYYEQALGYDDSMPLALNNLAWTYAEENWQLERALELALKALKFDPDRVEYWDTYAEVCYLRGHYQRAVAALNRALELAVQDAETADYLQQQMAKFRRALGEGSG